MDGDWELSHQTAQSQAEGMIMSSALEIDDDPMQRDGTQWVVWWNC